MKFSKRIFAAVVAVMMIFSVVSVGVFADGEYNFSAKVKASDGNVITSSKAGKTVGIEFYVTEGAYYNLYLQAMPVVKLAKADVVVNSDLSEYVKVAVGVDGTITLEGDGSGETFTVGTAPIATCNITIPADATGTSNVMTLIDGSSGTVRAGGNNMQVEFEMTDAVVSIIPTFTANAAVPSEDTRTVGLGTSQADAVKDITAKVTDGTNEEAGYAVSNWTSEPAYDADVAGNYTFKGDVVIDGEGAANEGTLTKAVTVTVTVGKIALDSEGVTVEAPEAKTYQKVETEGTTKAVADIVAELNADAAYKTTKVSKGKYEADATITWSAKNADDVLDLTTLSTDAENNVIVVGTLAVAETTNFQGSTTIEMVVKVVPAEIPGGAVSVSKPTSVNKASISATVPAEAVAKLTAGKKITAEIYEYVNDTIGADAKGTGEYTVTEDDITAANEGKDLVADMTSNDKMENLGFGSGVQFAVKVKVDGTLLLIGEGEDAKQFVTSKVLPSGSGTVTGIPSGNGGNSGNKDDKKDDANTTPDDEKDDATTPDDGNKDDTTPGTDAPATGFNDVPADHWAADFIKELADAGIINGDEDGNFNTEGKITRAEFTKMVAVLFGLEIKDDATVDFNDCGADDWFVKYVAAAVEAGYINGVGEGTFAPNDTISREDACTILGRALGLAAENANLNFADADAVADYAAQYIALLSELGFINGYEDGTFAPKNEITRAEAAKIIAGIYADKNAAANAGDNTEVEAEK